MGCKKSHNWLTPGEFNKLSQEEQNRLITIIDNYVKINHYTDKQISEILNMSYKLIRKIRTDYKMGSKKHNWLTPTEFNNLSIEKQNEIIENIKRLTEIDGLDLNEISDKLNISYKLVDKIKSEYNFHIPKHLTDIKIKNTNLKKYGVEHSLQNKTIANKMKQTKLQRYGNENYINIEKIKETNLKKYGAACSLASRKVKEKIKQTNLEKYGVENVFQSEIIKDKIKQTNFNKYGVEHASQCPEIKEKIKNTKLNRYGFSAFDINKMKQTNLERYGVEYNWQREDVKNKISSTCLKKYGVKWPCMTKQCRLSQGKNSSKINDKFALLLEEHNIEYKREFSLETFSYDFKIGNILLEINPTYTHNSTKGTFYKGYESQPIDKFYHYNKSKCAQDHGLRCIHVWDWDDWNKIISFFIPKQKIYARKCEIKEVSKQECDEFLNLYHLQNTCKNQTIRIGLYYNNELVQIITFGKPRYNKNYEWELLRLCSHKDYIVVGGSQRLWNHFLDNYNLTNIISYCDISKFSGKVYETLGMEFNNISSPGCNWSKNNQRITQNLLNQRGFDQLFGTNYGKGASNKDLMIENGWLEVYDCGQKSFIYVNKEGD